MPTNQMGTLRHGRAGGALPGVTGRGKQGPGVHASCSTHRLGARERPRTHRNPVPGHLTTPSLPRSGHVAGSAMIPWQGCPAGKHRVWSFLRGTGCLEVSFKEVGEVLPITATAPPPLWGLGHSLGWGYAGSSAEPPGFASEDVRPEGEILASEVRRTGSWPLLRPEPLRGPQAGHRPSLALGLPICATWWITARMQWGVARERERERDPVGILTPASLGLSFLLSDMGSPHRLGRRKGAIACKTEQGRAVAWLLELTGTVVTPPDVPTAGSFLLTPPDGRDPSLVTCQPLLGQMHSLLG